MTTSNEPSTVEVPPEFLTAVADYERNQSAAIVGLPCVIFENFVTFEYLGTTKKVSVRDFYNILIKQVPTVETESGVPTLHPPGMYISNSTSDYLEIGLYFSEARRVLSYKDYSSSTEFFDIPFPNLIISFRLQKADKLYKVSDAKYFITSKKVGELPSKVLFSPIPDVHYMPFSNFYTDGRMCYGGNTMPSNLPATNLRGLAYYFNVIFDSPFNSDLGITGISSNKGVPTSPRKFYKYLSELPSFPYEVLAKSTSEY